MLGWLILFKIIKLVFDVMNVFQCYAQHQTKL